MQAGTLNPILVNEWWSERVCELIDTNATAWDIIKLWALFDTRTCEKIMSVPPHRNNRSDRWAWSGEANGAFSIKSCYKLAMEESWKQISLTPNLFCKVPSVLWKSIWKLPVLSRFKVFLWRMCLDILPTVEALERRGMLIEDKCPWCNIEDEIGYHVLVECDILKQIWDNAPYNFNGRGYHGGENPNLHDIWKRVERSWDELITAEESTMKNQNQPLNLKWTKPTDPFIKLNVDIALKQDGVGAVGGVFRDHEGLCVGAFSGKVPSMGDVTLMEALGMRKGIEVARDVGITHIIVESDSKLVVDMLHSSCTHESRFSAVNQAPTRSSQGEERRSVPANDDVDLGA
ncbi:hypothetical protein G2W53_004436 [Senna tora]|uniref:Uncharacterized protein n=1 Tax=Senna tora TaxID=362788 RepID=A0A834XAV3_9FABA|nr:hypothetical protein G2W53_004436 [Senna tora]